MNYETLLGRLPVLEALLRRDSVAVGPDCWQSVYDLLDRLRGQDRWPEHTAELARLLGPLLCRSPEQQQRFPALFQEALTGQRPPPPVPVLVSRAQPAVRDWREGLRRFDRRWRVAAAALLAVALAGAAAVVFWPPNTDPFDKTSIKPQAISPEPKSSGEKAPPPPDASTIPITDWVAPNRLPEPSGFPANWKRWQIGIGYALAALPWLASAFLLLRSFIRRLRFRKAPEEGQGLLNQLHFDVPLAPLFGGPAAQRALSGLRPVLFRTSRRLDVTATVEATAHQAGYFQPRYRARRVTPVYLLLVRSLDRDDQRAALSDELAARFRQMGVAVRTYRFRDDPRWLVQWEDRQPKQPVELRQLAVEYRDAGLVVLSETEILFHPLTGRPRVWLDEFDAWNRRVWLHPRDAGLPHAELLWRRDFLALPLARQSLSVLVGWLMSQAHRAPQPPDPDALPLPDVLADDPEAWLAPHPPYGADLDALHWQLHRFLGTHGLLLFQALTVYPEPRWPLTLSLDYLLFAEREVDQPERREQRLARLSRLPWLRHAYVPQYLREDLLRRLEPDDRDRIRDTWLHLFGQITGEGRSGRLSLDIARPSRRSLRRFLRDLLSSEPDGALNDPIFLEVLVGGRLGFWELPIPRLLSRRLPAGRRRFDLRVPGLLLLAGLASAGLFAAWDLRGQDLLTRQWQQQIAAENARWPVTLAYSKDTADLAKALEQILGREGFPVTPQEGSKPLPAGTPNRLRYPPEAKPAAQRVARHLAHATYEATLALTPDPGSAGIAVDLLQTYQARAGFHDTLALSLGTKAGKVFTDPLKDGGEGPSMVEIPAGSFLMGSPADEPGRSDDESPQRTVTIAKPFAIGRTEVTFDDYDRFAQATGRERPGDSGWGRGTRPVINVSWPDANAYANWLSQQTGKRYRLPTEAEWEYAARGGTTTPYWWGNEIGRNQANCNGCGSPWDSKQTAPVSSFPANPFGLSDTAGNVWEWTADCWHENYQGAPADGSAWLESQKDNCSQRVVRGGSWSGSPQVLRSALRDGYWTDGAGDGQGFRLARDL